MELIYGHLICLLHFSLIKGNMIADHIIYHTWLNLEAHKPKTSIYKAWIVYNDAIFAKNFNRTDMTSTILNTLSIALTVLAAEQRTLTKMSLNDTCKPKSIILTRIFGTFCGGITAFEFQHRYCNQFYPDTSSTDCNCRVLLTKSPRQIFTWNFVFDSLLSINITFVNFDLAYNFEKCSREVVRIEFDRNSTEFCGRLPMISFYPGHHVTTIRFHSLLDSRSLFKAQFQVIQVNHVKPTIKYDYKDIDIIDFRLTMMYKVYTDTDEKHIAVYHLMVKKYLQLKCISSQKLDKNSFLFYDGPGLQSKRLTYSMPFRFSTFQGVFVVNPDNLCNNLLVTYWGVLYSYYFEVHLGKDSLKSFQLPNAKCKTFCILKVTGPTQIVVEVPTITYKGPNLGYRYG